MVLFSYKKRVPFLIRIRKDGKVMKKVKMLMGAVLCMNLLAVSGCDSVVQSAVVEEKNPTDQKREENKETVQKTVAEQVGTGNLSDNDSGRPKISGPGG